MGHLADHCTATFTSHPKRRKWNHIPANTRVILLSKQDKAAKMQLFCSCGMNRGVGFKAHFFAK